MSPEQIKINKLEAQVQRLEEQMRHLFSASEIDPVVSKTMQLAVAPFYDDLVTDYDRSVNEAGAGSYTVAKVFDGLFLINGKVVGYYDPV